jgi:uncharacterized protein (DUF4415 family)
MKKSSKTDWGKLAGMSDEEIDYSDIPDLPDSFLRKAKVWHPHSKVRITMELDKDVLEWFKAESEDWESRIQAALRLYAETHKVYRQTQA